MVSVGRRSCGKTWPRRRQMFAVRPNSRRSCDCASSGARWVTRNALGSAYNVRTVHHRGPRIYIGTRQIGCRQLVFAAVRGVDSGVFVAHRRPSHSCAVTSEKVDPNAPFTVLGQSAPPLIIFTQQLAGSLPLFEPCSIRRPLSSTQYLVISCCHDAPQ